MPAPKSKCQLFAWSPHGELLWSGLLDTFARAHGANARELLAELLVLQAQAGRDPELLPFQGVLLSLTLNIRPGVGRYLN
jgi:hypothetical protein